MLENNSSSKKSAKRLETVLRFLISPFSTATLTFSVLTFVLILHLFLLQLTWHSLNVAVTYQPGYLEVKSFGTNSFEELNKLGFISPGDRIVFVDDNTVDAFVAQGNTLNNDKILLYQTLEELNELPLEVPVIPGQTFLLSGVRASTMTIDISQRVNKTILTNNAARVNAGCSCSSPPNNIVRLDLTHLKYSVGQLAIIIVLIFTSLSFWAIGLFLLIARPGQPITRVFNILCNLVALEIELYNTQYYFVAYLEKFATILCNGFLGVVFLHFVLLFPEGQRLKSTTRNLLRFSYIYSFTLTALRLFVTFQELSPTRLAIEPIIRRVSNLGLITFFALALGVLGLKYFSSKGQDRLRLRMAVYAMLFSTFFPLAIFSGYHLFGIWQDLLSTKFAYFFFPSVLIPLTFAYAVLKNRVLGVGLRIRIFVVRLVLVGLISFSYLFLSTILTSVLPIWEDFSREPILMILTLSVLILLLGQLKHQILKVVDRSFQVDRLNYTELSTRWNNQLVQTTKVPVIVEEVLNKLPSDYHYKAAGLLLCHPNILSAFSNEPQNLREKDQEVSLLLTSNKRESFQWLNLQPEFWEFITTSTYTFIQAETLPEPIRLVYSKLEFSGNFMALPLKVGNDLYGALFFSEKSGEYIPPPEELEQIANVTNQIAVSFYNALLVNQAVLQAEKEKKLRRVAELVMVNEYRVRLQERRHLSEALHNNVLQDLITLTKDNISSTTKSTLSEVINRIRLLNFELMPRNLEGDMVGEIKRLLNFYQNKNLGIVFEVPIFEGDSTALENIVPVKMKEALYNAVKEAINNSIKHSQATLITTIITFSSDNKGAENADAPVSYKLRLEIADNGVGVNSAKLGNMEQLVEQQHFGLNNLKWNIETELGGKVQFLSKPGSGMRIIIDFVLTADPGHISSELEELLKELEKDIALKNNQK